MSRFWAMLSGWVFLVTVVLPAKVLAAGGGDVAPMVIVADTRKLEGLMKWWADLYNHSYVGFTVLTVVLIPIIGVIMGTIADIVMTHIGIDLKSRELAEH
ncbi:MAG: hypothetical protein MUF52_03985 [Syntrophobacteraceae bacterium]|nr:hypothetical protein [Syntrophobacteraceae bacterium]